MTRDSNLNMRGMLGERMYEREIRQREIERCGGFVNKISR